MNIKGINRLEEKLAFIIDTMNANKIRLEPKWVISSYPFKKKHY